MLGDNRLGKVVESVGQRPRYLRAPQFPKDMERTGIGVQGRLGSEAREFRPRHELSKDRSGLLGERLRGVFWWFRVSRGEWIFRHCVFTQDTRYRHPLDALNGSRLLFILGEIS